MADRKISDLTALTTPASGDFLPIVDISEAALDTKNKRITIEELMRGMPDGTAAAPGIAFESDTNTGIYSPSADTLAFVEGGVEAMRIDSSGRLLVGTSSSTDAKLVVANGSEQQVSFKINNTNSSPIGFQIRYETDINGAANRFIDCIGNATTRFLVFSNGNVQNTNNSYAGISDLKLKENIVESSSQWEDLKTLQVKNFNFIGDNNKQIGLVAQQVEQVCPGLVEESTDLDETGADLGTVTKSVKYSVLYMKAVRALQEAMERIEQLEADVALLKGA
jgi:hypothetical protein